MTALYGKLLVIEFALAVPVFILLMFVKAPYGKFSKTGWGPSLNARFGWFIMELPAVVLPLYFFIVSGKSAEAEYILFILIWELHYVQRTFVYPALLNRGSHQMPLLIILFSAVFNLMNGFIIGYGVFVQQTIALSGPRILLMAGGTAVFLAGFVINLHSDRILRRLRSPGETGYRIPQKGLFRFICSPNYLGEIIEWAGWTILTGSPASAAFLVFTVANLVPRAAANLSWYRSKFPDFPKNRKAIIPGVY